jgi:uncharacterized integral membrane protein (TIGR00698 family)
MQDWIKTNYKGIALSIIIGLSAHVFSENFSIINGVMLGLLLGIFIGNVSPLPNSFNAGISYTGSKLLEISIVFLAFNINVYQVSELGITNFVFVIALLILIMLISMYLAIKMECPDSTGYLIGFGTAICGSAAIAAIAPSISKKKEDIGIALAVVNLMGSVGMISLPFILNYIDVSAVDKGILIGATLHSVGNVAGAGYGLEKLVGETAITIKLARVAMLSPAVIFYSYLINKSESKNWKDYLKLPNYLWAFIIVTIFTTAVEIPKDILSIFNDFGKITLTIAMVAIGLKVSFKQLYYSGRRALGFGAVLFLIMIALVALFLSFNL